MAHNSFKYSCGKAAFGVLLEPSNCNDYIYNKKVKNIFCEPKCDSKISVNSQSNLNMYNKSKLINYYANMASVKKNNLNMNLMTKLDLLNVPVIQQNDPYMVPTDINRYYVPYTQYTIDPNGYLFGNDTCGINNYLNYIVYNDNIK
jgi:hypothetical protein